MKDIILKNISYRYARKGPDILNNISLTFRSGRITALLGPSGSGKTTLLKIIAGLLEGHGGRCSFAGKDVTDVPAEKRSAVLLFQNPLLFPFLTIEENIAFGLKAAGLSPTEIRNRVESVLKQLQIDGLTGRKPHRISGGQKQRAALGRALVLKPDILLLDEPFSGLDRHLREEMRELLRTLHTDYSLTTVFVTHDQEEALAAADDIALILDGNIRQFGRGREIYEHPCDPETAAFFGNRNLLNGRRASGGIITGAGSISVKRHNPEIVQLFVSVRPEHLNLQAEDPGRGQLSLRGQIIGHTYRGTHLLYRVELGGETWLVRQTPDREVFRQGMEVYLTFREDHLLLWPSEDEGEPS